MAGASVGCEIGEELGRKKEFGRKELRKKEFGKEETVREIKKERLSWEQKNSEDDSIQPSLFCFPYFALVTT